MAEFVSVLVIGFIVFVLIAVSSYVGALRALAVFHGDGNSIFLGDNEGPASSAEAD